VNYIYKFNSFILQSHDIYLPIIVGSKSCVQEQEGSDGCCYILLSHEEEECSLGII